MSNEEIKVIFLKHWKSTTEILNKSIDELKENIMNIEKTEDFSYYRKLQKESEELEKKQSTISMLFFLKFQIYIVKFLMRIFRMIIHEVMIC